MKAARIATDLVLLAGAGAVTYGAWDLLPAAGCITGGALLLVAGLARGRAEASAGYQNKRGNQ